MRVLVTGLGGFLGGEIGRLLLLQGAQLRTLSRRPLPEWEARGVEVLSGALEDPRSVAKACRDQQVVFHVAARAGVWGSFSDYEDSNVVGTINVLEACQDAGVKKLIYTSSPSVTFDGGEACGVNESKPYPEYFLNFYSETKARAEKQVLLANAVGGLSTVALRPHLIWGPGDPHLLPRLLAASRAGRLRQVGAGNNLVDITYIENAAQAHLLAEQKLEADSPLAGKAYFISDGEPVSLWNWIGQILEALGYAPVRGQVSLQQARLLGGALEWLYRTFRLEGEPPMTRFTACQLGTSHYYDLSAARQDFGYQPVVAFEEGMRRMLSYFRETRPATSVTSR